jgi:hypothetical protein
MFPQREKLKKAISDLLTFDEALAQWPKKQGSWRGRAEPDVLQVFFGAKSEKGFVNVGLLKQAL